MFEYIRIDVRMHVPECVCVCVRVCVRVRMYVSVCVHVCLYVYIDFLYMASTMVQQFRVSHNTVYNPTYRCVVSLLRIKFTQLHIHVQAI